jgi:phosphate transport system permease protein
MRIVSRKHTEVIIKVLCFIGTAIAVIPLIWVIGEVIYNGLPAISLSFFTSLPGAFGSSSGGIGNAILGTLIINGLASLFGLPLGILTGIYLSEYEGGSKLGAIIRTAVESLAGIPSLIFGLFAFTAIVLTEQHYTALAAALALGLMMIPLVGKATEESMRVISNDVREAAIAIGVPKWIRTTRIVLGIAKGGVLSGSLLAFARISGETAPLLFTVLFSNYWPTGVDQAMASLQVLIYNYATSGSAAWVTKAWGAALLLVIIVVTINIIVRYVTRPKYKEGY